MRHRESAGANRPCPACLLELALLQPGGASEPDAARPRGRADWQIAPLVVQLPLGETATGSVLLVHDRNSGRVFRLKTWRRPAAPGFMERFDRLQAQLEAWAEPSVAPPVAAWVDVAGYPAVLGTFTQGVPLVDRVRSGTLAPAHALSLLARLEPILRTAHDRELAHGSIVTGNVLCDRSMTTALLDFGLSAVLGSTVSPSDGAAADRVGLEALKRVVERIGVLRTNARPAAP